MVTVATELPACSETGSVQAYRSRHIKPDQWAAAKVVSSVLQDPSMDKHSAFKWTWPLKGSDPYSQEDFLTWRRPSSKTSWYKIKFFIGIKLTPWTFFLPPVKVAPVTLSNRHNVFTAMFCWYLFILTICSVSDRRACLSILWKTHFHYLGKANLTIFNSQMIHSPEVNYLVSCCLLSDLTGHGKTHLYTFWSKKRTYMDIIYHWPCTFLPGWPCVQVIYPNLPEFTTPINDFVGHSNANFWWPPKLGNVFIFKLTRTSWTQNQCSLIACGVINIFSKFTAISQSVPILNWSAKCLSWKSFLLLYLCIFFCYGQTFVQLFHPVS